MRKLVPESIEESLKITQNPQLNEGKMRDWLNKGKNFIKGMFKKIGEFFVAFYKNEPIPAMAPVNIGVLCKSGKFKFLNFIPSKEDMEIEPSLASMKSGAKILQRVRADYEKQAAANKARHKLAHRVTESYNSINEDMVKLAYPGEDKVRNVHTNFLVKRLLLQIKNPKLLPPLIWGAPGIGKTAITNAVVKTLGPGYRVIDVQTSKMSPDDWTLPAVRNIYGSGPDREIVSSQAIDIPKNWLPVYEPSDDPIENQRRDDVANWGEGGIIFLDELSRAVPEVQNTCLKLVHQRIIGDKILGSKWAIVAASNRMTDDPEGGQSEVGTALSDRFQQWNFVPTVDEWIEWGKNAKIDDRILTFVDFNRTHFYLFDNTVKINTTPRKWEALSHMLGACQEFGDIVWSRADMEDNMGGTIHSSTVEAFVAFLVLLETYTPKEIMMIFTDPEKAPKPKAKGSTFDIPQVNALIGAACSQSKDRTLSPEELENYVSYFCVLGDASLAAKAMYLIVETHKYIHKETGDDPKKAKYKPAMDIFRKAFGKISFANREDVMS